MIKYIFTHYYVRHFNIETSTRSFKGNLVENGALGEGFFIKYNWFKGAVKGGGRGCSDSSKGQRQMFADFKLYFLGPFFLSLGQWYGWVAKHPEMGFTNNEIGVLLFNRMITISRAYNFNDTKSGKRKWGLQIQYKKFVEYKGPIEEKDIKHPQIDRLIIDPHLKGKF